MSTFYLKYRDTLPILEVALLTPTSTAYDLSSARSVALHITTPSNTVLSRYMSIYSSTGGIVRYSWSSTDWTSGVEIGQNLMEYEVLTTGSRLTFPNCSYDILSVITDFAQAVTT